MKKVSLLIAMLAFVFGNAFAQSMYFDFEGQTEGNKIAQTLGDPWTTWSNAPGGAEDGVFGEADGSMAAHFTYGNDQVLKLGAIETGVFDLVFDAYVPNGKNGYFNVLHHFAGSNSTWACQFYLCCTNDGQNTTAFGEGMGTVHAGSNATAEVPCVYDQWMKYRVHIDMDQDLATLYWNIAGEEEQEICSWQWSLDSFGENTVGRTLDAMDFYPPENAATSEFYIDNIGIVDGHEDQVLIYDPFEEYTVGNKIAAEAINAGHDWWTTWSNAPGGNEDGVVADYDGTQCGYLTYGNDQVILLGDVDNGNYDLEFDILVPQGKNGYFNILHHFAGSNSTWAMQCYLHLTNDGQNSTAAPGHGTIHAGSNGTADVECVYDAWMHFRLNIDTDTDVANYYYTAPGGEEVLVCTWQWSLDSFGNNTVGRTLGAMDFFPPQNAANSEFYVDNFKLTKLGGESAPVLSVNPEAVDVTLPEDEFATAEVTITNDGNSIGDWSGWLDFGQGAEGAQTAELYYHNGAVESASGIGSDDAYTREFGIRLPATAYAGAAMGMKIVSAQFYVNSYTATDNNYIFRVYGQGLYGQPGALLAEKAVNTTTSMDWITATFDEPIYMTGQVVWVTVQLEQAAGEYPLTMDNGEYGEEGDGNWLSTNGNTFSHCYNAGNFGGAWLINVNCEGTLVPATWATIDKTEGSILGGNEDVITVTLNTIGLTEPEYTANLILNTNDAELPHIEIPVVLHFDIDAVEETTVQLASIYPNPATSQVTLEGENLNTVAIYNVAGQLVRIVKLNNVINNIDMNVESGVYFFSIYDNNGNNSVQRVVIVK